MPLLSFPPAAVTSTTQALLFSSGAALHLLPAPLTAVASSSSSLDAKGNVAGLIRAVALNDENTLAASAGDDKSLHLYDVVDGRLELRNTRFTPKRVACLSFAPGGILLTDKVGDVYLYPLEPRDVTEERPQGFVLASDPSLNPDADFLLGHVSIITQHLLSPGGDYIVTADRDEHIRVSRFPKSYVIERYLWGSEGFVSAMHIPPSRPNILVSGGGEATLQIFDWTTGELLRRVEIVSHVLPHRCVRAPPRKMKKSRKQHAAAVESDVSEPTRTPSDDPASEDWYLAPEGYQLPSGEGVVIEKIDSVEVDGKTVIVLFAEGGTALHSFVLDDETAVVNTQPMSHPILGFAQRPGSASQLVVALDTVHRAGSDASEASSAFAVVNIGPDAALSDVSSTEHSLVSTLNTAIAATQAPPSTLANLNLYPNLSLYPRWPGFEEDEELAGPASDAPVLTSEQADGLTSRHLGRLKASGMQVQHLLAPRKKRKARATEDAAASESV